MKAIMVMFDSLNRHMLPPYGCDWVHAPNFQRLARRTATFENSYVGSMPCMPARRELHTGRYNFLHRSWGPLEPFDDSMPELLKKNGISSHLISDHYHYWQTGGATYHCAYSTWDAIRGQEGDAWIPDLRQPSIPDPNPRRSANPICHQDWVNRQHMPVEEDMPQPQTFARGLEFLEWNHEQDNWFLQLETFDPHEPYFSADAFKDLYDYDFSKFANDWPEYRHVEEGEQELSTHYQFVNAALISMCDKYLGKILDAMDQYNLWEDTLLIVNTDHGFLLGEHDWWAKCAMPFYNEIAHTPLFIWDPRSKCSDVRRNSLVQTIDLPATILDYFNIETPADMQGLPLRETVAADTPVREAGLFGLHGGHVNCTDGRYVYMRAPAAPQNTPLYNYTVMPTHMTAMFSLEELRQAEMHPPLPFTKGCPVMRIPGQAWLDAHSFGTLLFDLTHDPKQQTPIDDPEVEQRMIKLMTQLMQENDCPPEQFQRLGLADA